MLARPVHLQVGRGILMVLLQAMLHMESATERMILVRRAAPVALCGPCFCACRGCCACPRHLRLLRCPRRQRLLALGYGARTQRPVPPSRTSNKLRCRGVLPRTAQTPGGLRWPAPAKHQGGQFEVPDAPCGGLRPLTIFHAFDWRIHSVKWKLDDLRNAGYDAVQISPLQKSIGDQQWWEATNSKSSRHGDFLYYIYIGTDF
jgi:hypothetical protein